MNNIYKSLLDFTILSFISTNEFWEEIILAFIVIIMNCLIIPLIKKLYAKLKLGKENEEKLDEKLDEIEDKFNDLTKKINSV